MSQGWAYAWRVGHTVSTLQLCRESAGINILPDILKMWVYTHEMACNTLRWLVNKF